LIDLDVEVDADAVLAGTFVKDLLEADGARGVNPDGHLGNVFLHIRVFGN